MDYRTIAARIAAVAALLLIAVAPQAAIAMSPTERTELTHPPAPIAAESPSPSLGATPQPDHPLPGDTDSDPDDWSGTPWIIAAAITAAGALGGVTYYLFRGGRLTWRRQDQTD